MPIWLRNIQLGTLSLMIGMLQIVWFDGAAVWEGGFLQGYTWVTAFVVGQVSLGGLLVALVMKYADNVVKGFATSLSIVLSSVVSLFIPAFHFSLTPTFMAGSALVIAATSLYSTNPAEAKQAQVVPVPSASIQDAELSAADLAQYERQL